MWDTCRRFATWLYLTFDLLRLLCWLPWVEMSSHSFVGTQELLQVLQDEGIVVSDETAAMRWLEHVSYFRLKPYASFLLRQARNQTVEFEELISLYLFDKKRRILYLDALERIEVSTRNGVAQILGSRGPFEYLKLVDGDNSKDQGWREKFARAVERHEAFTASNQAKAEGYPIWEAVELFDFGMLALLVSKMNPFEKSRLALRFGLGNGKHFANWLSHLNHVRNICAHHDWLWSRPIGIGATLKPFSEFGYDEDLIARMDSHRLSATEAILAYLVVAITPTSEWPSRLQVLREKYLTGIDEP